MSQAPHEQFLEWTFQRHWSGMRIALMIGFVLLMLVAASPKWLVPLPALKEPGVYVIFGLLCLVLFFIPIVIHFLFAPPVPPSRTLRIDRQIITLTDIDLCGHFATKAKTKEHRMSVGEVKFSVIHFGFSERLFSSAPYSIDSAYHIKITRGSETFLFPCNDEREQSQIIKQIKEFLSQ